MGPDAVVGVGLKVGDVVPAASSLAASVLATEGEISAGLVCGTSADDEEADLSSPPLHALPRSKMTTKSTAKTTTRRRQ